VSTVPTAPVLIHIIIVLLRILDVVVRHGYGAFLEALDHASMPLADCPVARRDVVGLLLLAEGCWLKARSPVGKEKTQTAATRRHVCFGNLKANHMNQRHSNQASAQVLERTAERLIVQDCRASDRAGFSW
jgi:hypothetical protein